MKVQEMVLTRQIEGSSLGGILRAHVYVFVILTTISLDQIGTNF